ncbi:hypothetical protein BOX15_Mlig023671g3 [Macrostomum lignano]|uniref:GCS light chain n=2 Tax=Macrostomum lignano TaxID=282301 RepID=A0A1I8HPX0_9PLAT|nr:hypothetical protein BOX15_Mlig023671g3 [Macrostomum lignano]
MNDIPILPKCRSIVFETGNILNWNRLKKRPLTALPASEEILDSIRCLFNGWLNAQTEQHSLQYTDQLRVTCPAQKQLDMAQRQAMLDDREELRIYIKLTVYIDTYWRGAVSDAVETALASLAAEDCDGVVLSLVSSGPQPPLLDEVKPIWAELEELRAADVVGSLGLADVDSDLLEQLYDWAAEKPSIYQLSAQAACTAPSRLREFASANRLQVLVHSDPADPLPADRLRDIFGGVLGAADATGWQPGWLARITTSYRHRGVVSSWGFVSKVQRQVA